MPLQFTKMHGLGNDFVVIDAIRQQVCLSPPQIRFLADRHFGVGCDQVLLIETATRPEADFRYRIFNPDGGEVGACGNGARCFARYVHERGLTMRRDLVLETLGDLIRTTLLDDGRVRVDMGVPHFAPEDIPFHAPAAAPVYPLEVAEETWDISVLALGNPHAVLLVDDVDQAPVMRLGPLIESHERFPARVNVGFLQIMDRGHARLRVFERGAGETLACGSGACAAAVAGLRRGLLDSEVTIELPGGSLTITWSGEGHSVMMTGPATFVFEGTVEL
ncbi:MAG: diaminopimelate epimerase [Gammaproteobacteria bacterium]